MVVGVVVGIEGVAVADGTEGVGDGGGTGVCAWINDGSAIPRRGNSEGQRFPQAHPSPAHLGGVGASMVRCGGGKRAEVGVWVWWVV